MLLIFIPILYTAVSSALRGIMYNFIDHEIKMEIFLFLWNIAVFVINMHMHVYFFYFFYVPS